MSETSYIHTVRDMTNYFCFTFLRNVYRCSSSCAGEDDFRESTIIGNNNKSSAKRITVATQHFVYS